MLSAKHQYCNYIIPCFRKIIKGISKKPKLCSGRRPVIVIRFGLFTGGKLPKTKSRPYGRLLKSQRDFVLCLRTEYLNESEEILLDFESVKVCNAVVSYYVSVCLTFSGYFIL